MPKILTVCRQGLCRSVALADVLKLHFEPVDVIPVGHAENANSQETLNFLCNTWADFIILMEEHYIKRLNQRLENNLPINKVLICDVGKDTYGNSKNPSLIDKVWRWTRANQYILGITEHNKKL